MSVGSIYFNQSNPSYLEGATNTNLILTGDFTIEFYLKCGSQPGFLKNLILCQKSGWGDSLSYFIFVDHNASNNSITILTSGSGAVVLTGNTIVDNNTWHHVAIVRNGSSSNNISLFIDGVFDVAATNTTTWDYSGLYGFSIGTNILDPNFSAIAYQGYLSNMRIVNGTALYTTTFTPSRRNLSAVAGTALLLNMAYDTPLLDSSPNNITVTSTGSPTPSTDSPVFPVVCFKEGSHILTDKGYLKIENLRKGDLVKTLKHGFVPINMIGTSKMNNLGNDSRVRERLYKCSADKYPEVFEDLFITGCHSILVDTITDVQREKLIELVDRIFVTDDKYRLIACVDERSEPFVQEGVFNVWHLALEHENEVMNYGIYANGLLVESTCKRRMRELSDMKIIE